MGSGRAPKTDKEQHPKRAPSVTQHRRIFSAIGAVGSRCDIPSPICSTPASTTNAIEGDRKQAQLRTDGGNQP